MDYPEFYQFRRYLDLYSETLVEQESCRNTNTAQSREKVGMAPYSARWSRG